MAEVTLTVNDRRYKITCDDGQEARLARLSAHLDERVRQLAGALGQIGETRLILLGALTVCDEVFELRERNRALETAVDRLDGDTVGAAARVVEDATRQVDALTDAARNQRSVG
ncbi:MAG: cell division protein ZapA [Pseudomonadota bacterium]